MARTSKGRIYQRGKKGTWYVQYYVDGKQCRQVLTDSGGKPICGASEEAKARRAADRVLDPVRERDAAERVRLMQFALESAEEKAQRAEADLAQKTEEDERRKLLMKATVAAGWRLFMGCPKRPRSCRDHKADEVYDNNSTIRSYHSYYLTFAKWCGENGVELLPLVTEENAVAFLDSLDLANGTWNKYRSFMSCFYETLLKAGRFSCKNPFSAIEPKLGTFNSKSPLSVEQVAKLVEAASGEFKLLIALGYFTGLRMGDCCTLRWEEVDMARGVIERLPNKTGRRVKDRVLATVKVGIPDELFGLLDAIPKEARRGFVLPEIAEMYDDGNTAYKVSGVLSELFRTCGIETSREGDGRRKVTVYGFHSLRYSYISHNAELGMPAAVIQRNAGHSNPEMTAHYTKISDVAAVRYARLLRLGNSGSPSERERLLAWTRSASDEEIAEAVKMLSERFEMLPRPK